ncbi:hypothetical protein QBC41DRAFT_323229 [Cercophora samala]|uniref:Nuclear pore protein n=1 Tax=Cercophora samala TaxID=330535 RepID=A0AA39ZBG9_9PEZI|nr:hypothetical protein QBC41DRAFT_323229 [Cercophora samala]
MSADETSKYGTTLPLNGDHNPHVLDDDGDLLLAVGTASEQTTFKVDASALRRASPVWKAMLFGPWAESKPMDGSKWVVELPEDDVQALTVMLGIIHNVYELVPGPDKMTVDLLWNILVLCDKYDMARVLKPWVPSWSQHIKSLKEPDTNEKMMFIAWELGDQCWFESLFGSLVLGACVNGKGHLVRLGDGFSFGDLITLTHLGPDSLLDDITTIRQFLITSLIGFLNTEVELRLSETTSETNGQHACLHKSRACDDLVLGGIIRATLNIQSTMHPKDATHIKMSVDCLQSMCSAAFEGLSTYHPHIRRGSSIAHFDCNPAKRFSKFAYEMRIEAMSKIIDIVKSDRYNGRMAKQREKLGWNCL